MSEHERLLRAKQAIIHGETVMYRNRDFEAEYKPVKLIWSIVKGQEQYSVQLVDLTAKSSTVDVRLQNIVFKGE